MSKDQSARCPGCRYDLSSTAPDTDDAVRCPECGDVWALAETQRKPSFTPSLMICGMIPAVVLILPVMASWIAYPFYSGTYEIVRWCGFTFIAILASWGLGGLALIVLMFNRLQHPPPTTRLGRPVIKLVFVVLSWITLPIVASYLTIDYAVGTFGNI